MMGEQDRNEDFTPQEAQERFEAAIRGARIVGHREMKDIPRKPRATPKKAVTTGVDQKSRRAGSAGG